MAISTGYFSNGVKPASRTQVLAALALILLLALLLRVINLGERNLWYDEAFAVLFAEKGLDAMLYGTLEPVEGGASDIHPLLYYSTLNVWMALFGQGAFIVRLWSVILGVVTVAAMFGLGRELFGASTGLAAALVTAIAPFHVQYSQEARMYALLGLLLVLATSCFVRAWQAVDARSGSWRWWIVFGILAGLAMYTQQLAAFYLLALALVPVFARRPDQLRGVVLGGLVAVALYFPWLLQLPGQLSKVQSYYWLAPPNVAQPLLTIRSFLVVNLDITTGGLLVFLGALFVVLFLGVQVVIIRRRRNSTERRALGLVLWLAGGPPLMMWLVSQVQPVYLERALLPSALMLYMALAWLFTRGGTPKPIALVVGVVCLMLVAVGLYYQYSWATFPNSPFRPATNYIRAQWQEGDIVIHQNKLTALPMVYYARDLPQNFIGDLPGSPQDTLAIPTQEVLGLLANGCVQAAAGGGSRVWWVTFDFAEAQYAAANRPEYREAQEWLNDHYTRAGTTGFNDLQIALYDEAIDYSPDCEAA